MDSRPLNTVEPFDGVITDLARKRCRMVGVELDDLVQEARLEAWTKQLKGEDPTEVDLINAMRRWIRAQKAGKGIVYEDVLYVQRDKTPV